jgi:hypothetical protein
MDRSKRRQQWQKAQALAAAYQDADGKIDLVGLQKAIRAMLDEHPELQDTEQQAVDLVRRLDEAHRPRLDHTQGAFWEPEAWLPTGKEGERVVMEQARETDFDAWWGVEEEAHQVETIAYAEKLKYRRSRKQAWGPADRTLGDVEERAFGWVRPPNP